MGLKRAEKKELRDKVRKQAGAFLDNLQLAVDWKGLGLSEEAMGYACGYLMYLADSLKATRDGDDD